MMDSELAMSAQQHKARAGLLSFASELSARVEQELQRQDSNKQAFDSLPFWAFFRRTNVLEGQVYSFGVVDALNELIEEAREIAERVGVQPDSELAIQVGNLMGKCYHARGAYSQDRERLISVIGSLT